MTRSVSYLTSILIKPIEYIQATLSECYEKKSGEIKFVGKSSDDEFVKNYKDVCYDTKIDASNCSIVPGLIDSHTHPIWEGDRVNEFKMKVSNN